MALHHYNVRCLRVAYSSFPLQNLICRSPLLRCRTLVVANQLYSFAGKLTIKQLFLQAIAHRDVPDMVAALTGYYATLGYQADKWVPTVTYGRLKTDNIDQLNSGSSITKEAPEAQYSWTGSIAYYVNSMVDLKVMAQLIHPLDGTNGMFNQSPGKANVAMYGFGADVIF